MTPSLTVARAELAKALRVLKSLCKAREMDEAVLSFETCILRISCNGATQGIGALGEWPGEARVPARTLFLLATSLHKKDPLSLTVRDGRFYIETWSVSCAWQQKSGPISLPLNAPLYAILNLPLNYTPEEIELSGLADRLGEAQEQKKAIVKRAYEPLRALGLSQSEVALMVDEFLGTRKKIS